MIFGKRERTERIRAGVDEDGRPILDGYVSARGNRSFESMVRDRYDRVCTTCGEEKHEGMYVVDIIEYGFIVPFRRVIDDVTFECNRCRNRFRHFGDA